MDIPEDGIVAALKAVLDKRNHPMLIHCNKGKVRRRLRLRTPVLSYHGTVEQTTDGSGRMC